MSGKREDQVTFSSYDLCGEDPRPLLCEEVEALKTLARMLPEEPVIVNIGAYWGVSTLAMLEERPRAKIWSVDIHECEEEFTNVKKAGLDIRCVTRVLGYSQEIDAEKYAPVDLLFVDGDHGYESVRTDILNWTRALKAGGIAAFHDYIPEPIPEHILSRVSYAVDSWVISLGEKPPEQILLARRLIAFRV